MTTKKYIAAPITPNAHLEQLVSLREVDDKTRNDFEKVVFRALASPKAMKAFRLIHIEEMAAAGYTRQQIGLAFADPDSKLHPLIDGLTSDQSAREFLATIKAAVEAFANLTDEDYVAVYAKRQERLFQETLSFLGRVESSQGKALIELAERLQQGIAEAHGVLFHRAGKRPSTKRSTTPSDASAVPSGSDEAPSEKKDPGDLPPINWDLREGKYKQNDDTED